MCLGWARTLARSIRHTDAVHQFVAALCRQVREAGGAIDGIYPPHKAERRFEYDGRQFAINPDAVLQFTVNGRRQTAMLEWERRAAHPLLFRSKLRPYVAYFSTPAPLRDFGALPSLLFVLQDDAALTACLQTAREMSGDSYALTSQLFATHAGLVSRFGPFGRIWSTSKADGTRVEPFQR